MNPQPPPLKFGPQGEFTFETLAQANLTPEEHARAVEIMECQRAYLEIIDTIGNNVLDPEGNVYDLSVMQPAVWAISWTLALAGARFSAPAYIKKQAVVGEHVPPGSYVWVDARKTDSEPIVVTAVAEPEPLWDGVKPEIVVTNEPRPDWM